MNRRPSDPDPQSNYLPRRIVSGGQTGVDRAGLDAAIALNLQQGGWCPKGRLSEDGSIPSRYELQEMDTPEYPPRTEQNVIDSDATLILYQQRLSGGTLLTRRYARRWNKPHLCLDIDVARPSLARAWLDDIRPHTLNIAGPRKSNAPDIEQLALEFLLDVFAPPNDGSR